MVLAVVLASHCRLVWFPFEVGQPEDVDPALLAWSEVKGSGYADYEMDNYTQGQLLITDWPQLNKPFASYLCLNLVH